MHIFTCYIHVKPECIEPFRRATIQNAAASRQEPGIARFDVIQQADDPSRFVLVEVYRNRGRPPRSTGDGALQGLAAKQWRT